LAYTALPSLKAYLLIAQDQRQVELFRRAHDWRPEVFRDEAAVPIGCLDATLPLDAIYEDVALG